jgi:hypothetical protein
VKNSRQIWSQLKELLSFHHIFFNVVLFDKQTSEEIGYYTYFQNIRSLIVEIECVYLLRVNKLLFANAFVEIP